MHANGRFRRVCSETECQQAMLLAGPGDEIVVADGLYADWDLAVACTGSERAPIVIRPESPQGVSLTDESAFKISGSHIILRDFRFEDCRLLDSCVLLDDALSVRVTACVFDGAFGRAPVIGIQGSSVGCRIDHCRFVKPEARSIRIVVRGEKSPMRTRIDHNLFQDVPPIPAGNGRETIQIGQRQPQWGWFSPMTIVENNTFLRCNGEIEIVSNKSSRNTYRNNLFKDCQGELVMRGASHCIVEGNRFENCTGGIRLSGTHHRVANNLIINSQNNGIQLRYGMTEELGGHYQAVGNCLIQNNTLVNAGLVGLFVGSSKNQDAGAKGISTLAPYDNHIENNIVVTDGGAALRIDDAPNNTITGNWFYAAGEGTGSSLAGNSFADPLLADNHGPGPGSPALGKGARITDIQTGPDA
ncbi:MAG: polysaccharide lyase 6 family protein [bacterium]|nr:polysaccharide lyase 6 family protein [bacterium]